MISVLVNHLITLIFIIAPYRNNIDTNNQDPLKVFPLNYRMEFIGTNSNDQIALLFKRESKDIFSYRIELLRKWKGQPFDEGIVRLREIQPDSVFVFEGDNLNCKLQLKIYQKKNELFTDLVATLQRKCKKESMNIEAEEFPELWNKGRKEKRK